MKETHDLKISNTLFEWKYPLWHSQRIDLQHCVLLGTARAGIWYSEDVTMSDTTIAAPKSFRRSKGIDLHRVVMPHADETLWNCTRISLRHVSATGDYFAMNSRDIVADDLTVTGNYAFDGVHDVEIDNATIISKDAFWNCQNVIVRNSTIIGEYLAWNSRNVTFINCTIQSLQGMCYIQDLVLKGCRLIDTTLAFERSAVSADVTTRIGSVKNPASGTIRSLGIDELILEPDQVDPARITIAVTDGAGVH